MLPGARNSPQDLAERGFIHAVRERNLPVDVFALDAHADYYLERSDIERLLSATLDEVCALGYSRIWLMGISLGGLGSLLCAMRRPADIGGVLLLAPYLGTTGIIAEVAAAGGLDRWGLEDGDESDHEHAFLANLRGCPLGEAGFPQIYLGYGHDDRFLTSSQLLLPRLPQERVLALSGGHDWDTWVRLWNGLLERDPFGLP
jgi:pimeloyl-ACP methyl ester carboxylesterase